MQLDGERGRKEKIKGKRRGREAVNQPVGWTPKQPEQNESKKAAAVQSAALLCSVRVQFRRAMLQTC